MFLAQSKQMLYLFFLSMLTNLITVILFCYYAQWKISTWIGLRMKSWHSILYYSAFLLLQWYSYTFKALAGGRGRRRKKDGDCSRPPVTIHLSLSLSRLVWCWYNSPVWSVSSSKRNPIWFIALCLDPRSHTQPSSSIPNFTDVSLSFTRDPTSGTTHSN